MGKTLTERIALLESQHTHFRELFAIEQRHTAHRFDSLADLLGGQGGQLGELLDLSRSRDARFGKMESALNEVKTEIKAMKPHVETVRVAKKGGRVMQRAALWIGGGGLTATIAWWHDFWPWLRGLFHH